MEKSWVFDPPVDEEKFMSLKKALGVPDMVARLLLQRGIDDFETARLFFRPSLENLHDPFLMKDMDKAVNRLSHALSKQEKIMIYGDYDVDGTTAVTLLRLFLSEFDADTFIYIPDRYNEGYGVSEKGIVTAKEHGVGLIITLDCGVKAIDRVAQANKLGMDVIICDHHEPGNTLPDAIAVLDPMQADCAYPFKGLSGCGVGFKLLHGFCLQQNIPLEKLYAYSDLVAISIAADIVPVVGENRILSFFGLALLNDHKIRPGIAALLGQAKFGDKKMQLSDLVFTLAPRINAAGRIKSARTAVDLLCARDEAAAHELSVQIESHNDDRRELDVRISEEALLQLKNQPHYEDAFTSVVHGEDWHKGVIGIVASRLIEHVYRPTIVFSRQDNGYTGSARSVKGINIHDVLQRCAAYIEQFGGHAMAAGLRVREDKLPEFKLAFETAVAQVCQGQKPQPSIRVNALISFEEITPKLYRIIQQFAPFGPGNMKPSFVSEGVINHKFSRTVGASNTHLKLDLKQRDCEISGIGFGLGEKATIVLSGEEFDLVYNLDENQWNGKTSLQLVVKDIKERMAPRLTE